MTIPKRDVEEAHLQKSLEERRRIMAELEERIDAAATETCDGKSGQDGYSEVDGGVIIHISPYTHGYLEANKSVLNELEERYKKAGWDGLSLRETRERGSVCAGNTIESVCVETTRNHRLFLKR